MPQWASFRCSSLFINTPFLQRVLLGTEFWDISHSRHMFHFGSGVKLFIKAVTPISTSSVSEHHIFGRFLTFFNSICLSCLFLTNNEVKNILLYVYWPIIFPVLWNAWFCLLLILYLTLWIHPSLAIYTMKYLLPTLWHVLVMSVKMSKNS